MSKPISYVERIQIVRLRKKGKTYQSISDCVGCSVRSVQRLWKRYQDFGEAGLKTNYHQSGRKAEYDASTWERVDAIQDADQGAPYIRSVLLEKFPEMKVPHERTIQRKWASKGQNRPRGKPKRKSTWIDQPGHTYQIDGKDQMSLKTGQQISWMKVADEASSTDLSTQLFSH